MTEQREYSFPVWGTQGGGLVRAVKGVYIFVEKPDCPGLVVGDELPAEWDIIPANTLARETMPDEESVASGLFEALGTQRKCPGCREMVDISQMERHELFGCEAAKAIGV